LKNVDILFGLILLTLFLLTLFTDPITSGQAMTGQAYTANGTLTLTSGAFSRAGANLGQAIFYGLDAGVSGARIAGSII
jgi:hypothetical protein